MTPNQKKAVIIKFLTRVFEQRLGQMLPNMPVQQTIEISVFFANAVVNPPQPGAKMVLSKDSVFFTYTPDPAEAEMKLNFFNMILEHCDGFVARVKDSIVKNKFSVNDFNVRINKAISLHVNSNGRKHAVHNFLEV